MTQTTQPSAHASAVHSRKSVRLTTAQALVRYLQVQHSERDGNVQRAIPAHLRDLRPRERARPRPGDWPRRIRAAALPAQERAGDGPHRDGLRKGQPPPARHSPARLDRTRCNQHDHRRGHRDREPASRPAAPRRYLRQPQTGPGAPAARAPKQRRPHGQRRLPPGLSASSTGSHAPSSCSPRYRRRCEYSWILRRQAR